MSTLTQERYRRLLIQLADLPWMIIAWGLGLLFESASWKYGLWVFSPPLTFWIKVVAVYAALGYASFLLNRSVLGFVAGAAIGLAWQLINLFVYPMQSSRLNGVLPHVVATGWCAVVPFFTDRILDPWLMRGLFRWLASHHARYERLRR